MPARPADAHQPHPCTPLKPPDTPPPQTQVLTDRPEYKAGQPVALVLQNPYWGPASALVVWGNKLQRKQRVVAQARGVAGALRQPAGAVGWGRCGSKSPA
jgi:hypothetical protein